ncbi:MAG: alkyl sulfatase dimerization domain-containing protein [Pseudomonadota bacterium]
MKKFLMGFACGVLAIILVAGIGAYLVLNPGSEPVAQEKRFASVSDVASAPSLKEHTKIFEQRIEEVIPNVHVAIGYGLANVIIIEAPEGLIVVDTLESIRAAEKLLPWIDELRKRSGKAITDIIYTHNHADHVFGAGVFIRGQEKRPRIWAHKHTAERVYNVVNVLRPIIFKRSMRQFGTYLPDAAFENAGIGPFLDTDHSAGVHFLKPTHVIDDHLEQVISGERIIFRHAPGETPDQLLIYFPTRKLLLPADNYYHAFPNLYAIRGTPYRDVRQWAESIDAMIRLAPEIMIPQHTQPVIGAEEIREQLTSYRDAIQFVHDQTVRMINKGMTADQIATRLILPPHLANAPYLQPFYGRVDWASRAVFSGVLGWFSGDPEDLLPVAKARESELISRLAGGNDRLKEEFKRAMEEKEPAWALVLATHMYRLGDEGANAMRAQAMRALGEREISATGRNYFLTMAAEVEGFEIPRSQADNTPLEVLNAIPVENYLNALQVGLKAEDVLDIETAFGFNFTDLDAPYTMRIRRGIAVIETGLTNGRAGTLIADSSIFKQIAAKRLSPAAALLSGELRIEGGPAALQKFLGYFEQP